MLRKIMLRKTDQGNSTEEKRPVPDYIMDVIEMESKRDQDSPITKVLRFIQQIFQPGSDRYDMLYRYEHTMRVASIGELIANAENLEKEPVVIACLLHDIGYAMCNNFEDIKDHASYSEQIARIYLEKMNFTNDLKDKICNSIRIHSGDINQLDHEPSPFELTVRDADDIDRMDAMRLGIVANSIIGENSASDVIKNCENKIIQMEKLLNQTCGTKTADNLLKDRVVYQIEYYQRLIEQMKLTEFVVKE